MLMPKSKSCRRSSHTPWLAPLWFAGEGQCVAENLSAVVLRRGSLLRRLLEEGGVEELVLGRALHLGAALQRTENPTGGKLGVQRGAKMTAENTPGAVLLSVGGVF